MCRLPGTKCHDHKGPTLLVLIGEVLDWLANAKIYTKLDVKDVYHNLRIAEGNEWKTAFWTKYGLYKYLVMPFGLTNALASFQQWMNEVLSDYLDIFCIAYLNDILIYSDNLKQYCQHVRRILERVEEVGLMLKALKYEFHTDRMEYLGYIISPTGMSMDLEKVKAMVQWRQPTNVKQVQSFLGFANFYRRFIQDFYKIMTALTKLTRKDNAILTTHGNGNPPPCVLNNEQRNLRFFHRIRIRSTHLRISVNFQRVLR
jgi:hypothetical protein